MEGKCELSAQSMPLKAEFNQKLTILSFTPPHVISDLYDILRFLRLCWSLISMMTELETVPLQETRKTLINKNVFLILLCIIISQL